MDGQKWEDFLKSVRTSGIIEPVIVTQDLVIVSGHQRVRAAKAIGLTKIAVEVRHYADDDKVLKDLIETNIMQRGIGNTNPIKLAKCIAELERILGIREGSANEKGNNRIGDGNNFRDHTQADLAEKLKISQRQLSNYKRLLDLIPELQTAVESGQISATNASAILARLPEAEQKAIAEQIVGTDGKVSRQELEFYKNRVAELSAQKPQTIEKIVEVESKETLRKLRRAEQSASDYKADYEREKQRTADKQREVLRLREELQDAKEQTKQANFSQKLIENAAFFMTGCGRFISEYGGLVWIVDHLEELPEQERTGYIKAVNAVYAWANTLKQNIEGGANG
jgi:ParB-like chromosome segregation protein Spo0J